MKANAKRPWSIHRVTFMQAYFPISMFQRATCWLFSKNHSFVTGGFIRSGISALLLIKDCPPESGAFESPKSAPRPHAALPCLYVRGGIPRQGRNHAAQPSQGGALHRIRTRIRLLR